MTYRLYHDGGVVKERGTLGQSLYWKMTTVKYVSRQGVVNYYYPILL